MWNWIKGASKVTADKTVEVGKFTVTKTVEVSKVAVDKSKEVAASDETKKLLNDVGGWWNTGVGGWFNNVASRAAKGESRELVPARGGVDDGGADGRRRRGHGRRGDRRRGRGEERRGGG